MNKATRTTVAVFGTIAGLAGIEHGVGELVQGNRAPDALVFASWPDSALFRIVAGEPAMTIVPNLLLTGTLAIVVSLFFLVWVTLFAQRKHAGLALIGVSLVLLLVGGGFGPPLLGLILGLAATRIDAPLAWWRVHLSRNALHVLSTLWPWSLAAGVIAWLLVMPGSLLLDYYVGVSNPDQTIVTLTVSAFGLLFVSIVTALARDAEQRSDVQHVFAPSS